MIVVEKTSIILQSALDVVEPELTNLCVLKKTCYATLEDIIIAGIARVSEVVLPRSILYLTLVVYLEALLVSIPCVIIASHVVVSVVTSD